MEKAQRVYRIFEEISSSYDRANDRISLGQHLRWKRAAVRSLSPVLCDGARVLDLCCGTGDMIRLLLEQNRSLEVVGVDFSPRMLEAAREKLKDFPQVTLMNGDAMALPFPDGAFDAAVLSFALRNTENYAQVLGELSRVVRPGGMVCCVDSFSPTLPPARLFHRLYFSGLMPLLGGGRRHRQEYVWLWESTRSFISAEELRGLMESAGLGRIQSRAFLFGACAAQTGIKIGSR